MFYRCAYTSAVTRRGSSGSLSQCGPAKDKYIRCIQLFSPHCYAALYVSGNEIAALISLERAGGSTTGKRQVSPAIVQLSDHDSGLNSGECKLDSGQCVCV